MLDGIVQKSTDIMKKHNYKYDVIRIVLTVLVVIAVFIVELLKKTNMKLTLY